MPFCHHPSLRCPIDQLPLELTDGSLRCSKGHSFDLARQGYVNLLNAQDKRSKDPGDSREMVMARRRFLQGGYYRPIADSIGRVLQDALFVEGDSVKDQGGAASKDSNLIVDAGCGEGYYLTLLRQCLRSAGIADVVYSGFDVSKWAMQAAAKQFEASWLVASNRNIPLADGSAAAVLDMFGFSDFSEFARILRPGGCLIVVAAGDDHLCELRDVIYDKPKAASNKDARLEVDGFSLREPLRCGYSISIDQSDLQDLLVMTPHFFRASAQGKQRLAALPSLNLTVDVRIDVFARDAE